MTVGGPFKRSNSAPALVVDEWDIEESGMAMEAPECARWAESPGAPAKVTKELMVAKMGARRSLVETERDSTCSSHGRTTPTTDMSSMSHGVHPHTLASAQYSGSVVSAVSSAQSVGSTQASHRDFHDAPSTTVSTQSTPRKLTRGLNSNAAPFVPSAMLGAPAPGPDVMKPAPLQHTPSYDAAPVAFPQDAHPQGQGQAQYPGQYHTPVHTPTLNKQPSHGVVSPLSMSCLSRQGSSGPPQASSPYQQHPTHGAPQQVASPSALSLSTRSPPKGQHTQKGNVPQHQPAQQQRQQPPAQQGRKNRRGSRTRSRIVEEFRQTNASRPWQLADIAGHVVEFAHDQEGSRFLQKKIECCSPDERRSLCNEVLPSAPSLMQDVFGNYVVQKLLQHGDDGIRHRVFETIRGNVLSLSLHTYGCRTVQRALEVMNQQGRDELCHELLPHIARCVTDQNGNHVIQKIVEVMPTRATFVIDAFVNRVSEFSVHAYGCRCVQRVLEHCKNMNEVAPVMDEILRGVETLVTDQFGNYVVQHVVMNGHPRYQYAVVQLLKGYYSQLSTHKFASNVIEKMFEHAPGPVRMQILDELTTKQRDDGVSGLVGSVMDQYGNYVMQKIFDFCDAPQKAVMANHLRPNANFLKRAPFGKHFILRLEKQGFLSGPGTPMTQQQQQQQPPQQHQQRQPSPPHNYPPHSPPQQMVHSPVQSPMQQQAHPGNHSPPLPAMSSPMQGYQQQPPRHPPSPPPHYPQQQAYQQPPPPPQQQPQQLYSPTQQPQRQHFPAHSLPYHPGPHIAHQMPRAQPNWG